MTPAVSIEEDSKEPEEEIILKSSQINETASLTVSNTRELLKKAKEAADQKFAKTKTFPSTNISNSAKLILKGKESPAWHGQLIKTKLNRTNKVQINNKRSLNLNTKTENVNSSQFSLTTTPVPSSLFEYFKVVRREYEDFREIEAIRLQKRLEKLSDFKPEEGIKKFEDFEKEIVPWQNDSSTNSCYLCTEEFTILNRRHHCRLCGRIICGSENCLSKIPIKLMNFEVKELKSCTKCYKFLFKKKKIEETFSTTEEKMNNLYKKIRALKDQLLDTIPRFNEYLLEESITEARPLEQWRQDAWTLRDTLILYSVHFRSTIQELAEVCEDEALEKPVFKIFANNLRRAGNEFLQKHMFTLQIIDIESVKKNSETKTESSIKADNKDKSKLFPKLLNELFNVSNNNGTGEFCEMIEFYTEEGDVLNDAEALKHAMTNQQSVLKEQLGQLEVELGRTKDSEDKFVIQKAINDIKNELKRIK